MTAEGSGGEITKRVDLTCRSMTGADGKGAVEPGECQVNWRVMLTTVPVSLDWILRVPPSWRKRSRIPPNPRRRGRRRRAPAVFPRVYLSVIPNFNCKLAARLCSASDRGGTAGMTMNVGEAFLNDAEDGELGVIGQRWKIGWDLEIAGELRNGVCQYAKISSLRNSFSSASRREVTSRENASCTGNIHSHNRCPNRSASLHRAQRTHLRKTKEKRVKRKRKSATEKRPRRGEPTHFCPHRAPRGRSQRNQKSAIHLQDAILYSLYP